MGRVWGKKSTISSEDEELHRATASAVGSTTAGYDLDMKLREFEISQLTQRNNFFMIFQGVMIAGLIQSQGNAPVIVNFYVCLTGMFVSVFQIGMAGGAKFWQSRWESSSRTSEIEIVLKLLQADKHAIRTFTHDIELLDKTQKHTIKKWNQDNPSNQIENLNDYISEVVLTDTKGNPNRFLRHKLDWWVRRWGILPKWSVSRIPLWVGAVMLIFWTNVWIHTWRIPFLADMITNECKIICMAPLVPASPIDKTTKKTGQ